MTYEEAKMQIQAIPEKIWDQLSEPDREAMEMAFSALQEQEAKTQLSAEGTTSDLISRQAAIDAINEICERCGEGKKYNGVMCGACNLDGVADIVEDLPSAPPEPLVNESRPLVKDAISRQDAIDALMDFDKKLRKINWYQYPHTEYECRGVDEAIVKIENVPSAQTEPLSDAYTKAVWTWLLDYQIKAVELKGRYTPYEVLSWVANDWRKEHERSD